MGDSVFVVRHVVWDTIQQLTLPFRRIIVYCIYIAYCILQLETTMQKHVFSIRLEVGRINKGKVEGKMVQAGLKGRADSIVTVANTAKNVGSGSLEVFATPMMVALMENAAIKALNLPEDQTSVGTYLDVRHLAATPVGMKVWAEAEVIEVDGRKLVYKLEAYDEQEKIGEGRHERFIVNCDKFISKANAKLGL